MALSGASNYKAETVEAEVEIKSNSGKLFKLISNQHHDVPKASSDNVHDVAVHEDGNVETLKEKVEIDEANKLVSLTALEGSHVLEKYKSCKIIFQVTPKSEGGLVKITLGYQRLNENDPPPHKYLRFLVNVIQDIDAHLLKE
ncbi:hypothetical protein PRUPE_1G327600 [Prunus persica]|uniref:Bet v I/Major latex protein domain-containing protein n=1 Tax=Prunus persica TaxID=3760 RepID=A0A251R7N7_PRUPE|nr:hypothetical protein PRUPE_1G327600 [Prunus persica]